MPCHCTVGAIPVMSTQTQLQTVDDPATQITRVAAAVDDRPEGRDAAVLATSITAAGCGDCVLIAIEPDLSLIVPYAHNPGVRRETERMLAHVRADAAPGAFLAVDCDYSVARGIERMVRLRHRQLLVVGSRRGGPEGLVSIGRITRQLLHDVACPIAIAPRGLSGRDGFALRTIAVGFDGGVHSELALTVARGLALGAGAKLIVRGVVDDRVPPLGWPNTWLAPMTDEWRRDVEREETRLNAEIEEALRDVPVDSFGEVTRGSAAASLVALSSQVDLIVIGSPRWGAVARLLLGGTGEALARESRAPLLVVPAPSESQLS